ncbi:MAG: hypothetical protein R2828_16675 [Saprospiraceae bacterium]
MIRTRLFIVFALGFFFTACQKEKLEVGPTSAALSEEVALEERASNVLMLKIENANVQAGAAFCVDVKTRKFDDILGMQYSIGWDAAVLAFSHVTNFNLPGLDASSFGNPSADRLTTLWLDPNLTGLTLANNTVVYSICFDAIGDPGDRTNVFATDNPTPIEIFDSNFDLIDLKTVAGKVSLH